MRRFAAVAKSAIIVHTSENSSRAYVQKRTRCTYVRISQHAPFSSLTLLVHLDALPMLVAHFFFHPLHQIHNRKQLLEAYCFRCFRSHDGHVLRFDALIPRQEIPQSYQERLWSCTIYFILNSIGSVTFYSILRLVSSFRPPSWHTRRHSKARQQGC